MNKTAGNLNLGKVATQQQCTTGLTNLSTKTHRCCPPQIKPPTGTQNLKCYKSKLQKMMMTCFLEQCSCPCQDIILEMTHCRDKSL